MVTKETGPSERAFKKNRAPHAPNIPVKNEKMNPFMWKERPELRRMYIEKEAAPDISKKRILFGFRYFEASFGKKLQSPQRKSADIE